MKNPAINVRYLGFEKLKQQGEKAIEPVKTLLASANPYHQARAVWLLAQLGENGQKAVEKLLESKDNRLAVTAFRALRQVYATDKLLKIMEQSMERAPSVFLSREYAIALRDVPLEKSKGILLKIIEKYDGQDAYLLAAIGMALEGKADAIFSDIERLFQNKIHTAKDNWYAPHTQLVGRLRPVVAVSTLKKWSNDAKLNEKERKKALTALAFIKDKTAAEAMLDLSKSTLPDVVEQANYWLSFRQSNDWADLLDWKKTGIDVAKEQKRAAMKAAKTKILNQHIAFWDRNQTVQKMAKDAIGGQLLIGMVADKTLPQDLYPSVETLIFNNPDQSVRVQASQYFKRPSGKMYVLTDIAKLKPDIAKGKNIFQQSCATCHKVGKMGNEIGPDLTLIGKKFDRIALLDAIVNPSAAIVFGYEPWLITTKDGDSIFGFLLADDKTVVIKDAAGQKHNILKENITKREKQANSMMPDPTTMGLSEKDLANLTEYLLQFKE